MSIFEIYYGKRFMGFAQSEHLADKKVRAHWAFCEKNEGKHCVGTNWSNDESIPGWRIIEKCVEVKLVCGELIGDPARETAHLSWKCPNCGTEASEDWRADDVSLLVYCSCKEERCYVILTAT